MDDGCKMNFFMINASCGRVSSLWLSFFSVHAACGVPSMTNFGTNDDKSEEVERHLQRPEMNVSLKNISPTQCSNEVLDVDLNDPIRRLNWVILNKSQKVGKADPKNPS